MITDRERFLAVLYTQPLRRSDAIVVLTGDGEARLPVVIEMLSQQAAGQIVVVGGLNHPPYSLTAESMKTRLIEKGVRPDCIYADNSPMNTRDQAVAVAGRAKAFSWHAVLLVASPYHDPRAFLTFIQAFTEAGIAEQVRLTCVSASHTRWFTVPEGETATRLALYDGELQKIEAYTRRGHVASYEAGLAYLQAWEDR